MAARPTADDLSSELLFVDAFRLTFLSAPSVLSAFDSLCRSVVSGEISGQHCYIGIARLIWRTRASKLWDALAAFRPSGVEPGEFGSWLRAVAQEFGAEVVGRVPEAVARGDEGTVGRVWERVEEGRAAQALLSFGRTFVFAGLG